MHKAAYQGEGTRFQRQEEEEEASAAAAAAAVNRKQFLGKRWGILKKEEEEEERKGGNCVCWDKGQGCCLPTMDDGGALSLSLSVSLVGYVGSLMVTTGTSDVVGLP